MKNDPSKSELSRSGLPQCRHIAREFRWKSFTLHFREHGNAMSANRQLALRKSTKCNLVVRLVSLLVNYPTDSQYSLGLELFSNIGSCLRWIADDGLQFVLDDGQVATAFDCCLCQSSGRTLTRFSIGRLQHSIHFVQQLEIATVCCLLVFSNAP